MNRVTDERFRGSIGDLRAFQRPGLETGVRELAKGRLADEIVSGMDRP